VYSVESQPTFRRVAGSKLCSACCLLHAGILLGLLDSGERGNMFLQNTDVERRVFVPCAIMRSSVLMRWQHFLSKRVSRKSGNFLKFPGHSFLILENNMMANL
jgi:hypothetical protein